MEKKKYIRPSLRKILCRQLSPLLAASGEPEFKAGGNGNTDDVFSKEMSIDGLFWEDETED